MDPKLFESTVSDSKEESMQKALELLLQNDDQKPVVRPDISVAKTLLAFFVWLAVCGGVIALAVVVGGVLGIPPVLRWCIAVLIVCVIVCFKFKAFVKSSVLLYQKLAPEKVRRSCLFTPTCSEYMLLAIDKYGAVVGVKKGIGRLCRCNRPNGGVDYP